MAYYHKTTQTPKQYGSFIFSVLCLILALANAFFPALWPYAQKCSLGSPCYPWVTFFTLGFNVLALILIIILIFFGRRKLKLPHNHQQFAALAKAFFVISLLSVAALGLYRLVLALA